MTFNTIAQTSPFAVYLQQSVLINHFHEKTLMPPLPIKNPPLTGWLDEDRGRLASLNPMEQVDYFEYRVRRVSIAPLARILDSEIHPIDDYGNPVNDASALLIFGLSLNCTVEALGKFMQGDTGRGHNRKRFTRFAKDHLLAGRIVPRCIGKNALIDRLWLDYRNGLAHGFAVACHGGFSREVVNVDQGGPAQGLRINPDWLFQRLQVGFDAYLENLRNNILRQNFKRTFNDVFVNGN